MLASQDQKIRAKKRDLHGILLLDKPVGITSNAALQKVKHLYGARKAGHTGSLDPLASGMLPICFGEATKFSQYLLSADKRYLVIAKLGIKTTTGDAEGEVIQQQEPPQFSQKELHKVLQRFTGTIAQIPSMYSALKHQGQPLYKLARQGIEVERAARQVQIYDLQLLGYENNQLTIDVSVSKGTYIRTLVEDIGDALGCGAHVVYLRRLAVGGFAENAMVQLPDIEATADSLQQWLLPVAATVQFLPEVRLTSSTAFYLRRGESVMVPNLPASGLVRILSQQEFLGVGEVVEGKLLPQRLVSQRIDPH